MNEPGVSQEQLLDVCAAAEVDEGAVIKVELDDHILAVYHIGDEFFVTDDHCTHGPGSLSEGWLTGHEIECDFHQGCFDIRTGEVTSPPPMLPVRTYRVFVDQGRVRIDPRPSSPGG